MDGCPFRPGDRVTWRHVPRGGWGLAWLIPAVVLGFGRARVKIDVERRDGAKAIRYVEPGTLRARED